MGSFESFYRSEVQGVWALLPVTLLFLVYLGLLGRRRARDSQRPGAGFVLTYCTVFAFETLIDPLAGPAGRRLGLPDGAQSAVMFLFVWLGDFRVFALVFGLGGCKGGLRRAALWSFAVPAVDLALYFGLLRSVWPAAPGQLLWLIHEVAFLALALAFRARLAPGAPRGFLRGALAYAALYYGLWAAADLGILAGLDPAWGLRVLPNQLYYAFWVPFVFFSFFWRR